jgi:hypothetical protein
MKKIGCVPVQVDGDHCREVEGLRFAIAPDKN